MLRELSFGNVNVGDIARLRNLAWSLIQSPPSSGAIDAAKLCFDFMSMNAAKKYFRRLKSDMVCGCNALQFEVYFLSHSSCEIATRHSGQMR